MIKYVDLSTRAPKFSTQVPWFFIIKICFAIKVNAICGAGKLLVSGYQESVSQVQLSGSCVRILGLRVASPKSQVLRSRVPGVRVLCPRVPDSKVPGSQFRGPRPQDPGSRVSGPDFRLCLSQMSY